MIFSPKFSFKNHKNSSFNSITFHFFIFIFAHFQNMHFRRRDHSEEIFLSTLHVNLKNTDNLLKTSLLNYQNRFLLLDKGSTLLLFSIHQEHSHNIFLRGHIHEKLSLEACQNKQHMGQFVPSSSPYSSQLSSKKQLIYPYKSLVISFYPHFIALLFSPLQSVHLAVSYTHLTLPTNREV